MPPGRGRRGGGEVAAVGQDDVRALAAALERHALHVRLARVAQEQLADLGRAGERDHVDVGVEAERLPGARPVARDDLQHALGQPRLDGERADPQRRQRRLLGRLEHDAVADGERGRELPRRHEEREVPRHDRADDAERLAVDHGDGVASGGRDLVVDLVDGLGVALDALGGEADVGVPRLADRLAHVQRLEQAELVGVLADQLGQAQQHLLALPRGRGRPAPGLERGARAGHGAVDVLGAAGRDLGEQPAVDRTVARECGTAQCVDVRAVDERLPRHVNVGRASRPVVHRRDRCHSRDLPSGREARS